MKPTAVLASVNLLLEGKNPDSKNVYGGGGNARLVAAAPELLAAGLRALAFMEKRGIGMGEHDLRMAVGKAMGLDPAGVSEAVKAEVEAL